MSTPPFVEISVLKRDVLSETVTGHMADDPGTRLAWRRLDRVPGWSRPLAGFLARREARALAAVQGIPGCPVLLSHGPEGILRIWSDGTPLHLARPDAPGFYRDAKRLLREMRRRGVTHNDTAKPQNWLLAPDGRAEVIDFQLAHVHRRRGTLFRTLAREDLRHLLKQKRAFAPDLLTPSERTMLARKALPSRLWMVSVKPVYNFVTRRVMNWSDGEGTEDRLDRDGPAIRAALARAPGVAHHLTVTYPQPGRGVGLYTFAETELTAQALRQLLPASLSEKAQPVPSLPRDAQGNIRADLLSLIAANRLDEVEERQVRDPTLRATLAPILAGRQNLTDRYLRG
ncbi:serine/threonine protein kinase [Pseudooceanicola aestuarii]|uniref:serine/threonine protein kinase n=1 Tax=Pseudooceanicola aestuarii TaxID=2697319 RepID=UPI0013D8CD41|nr:serine/threonine protein kinase [Pseudooceanicola aestuarii]